MPCLRFAVPLLAGLALAEAHGPAPAPTQHLVARQTSASSSSRSRTTRSVSDSSAGAAAQSAAATGLSAIGVSLTSEATSTLPTSVSPGASLTVVSGAPALPTASLVVANYPTLDQVPPTDSDEVKGWLAEIDLTQIPTNSPTGLNGCSNTSVNAQAIANAGAGGNCWWTCGGCTRESDVSYCPTQGDWGLSYDDGPSPWTPRLLDYLTANNLKSTFFVVGSRVLSRPAMLQAEYALGHQISVHTWSHPYLTTLTNEEIVAELGWSKKVIKDTIGVTPNTFRPPYGDIDDRVRYIALQMGLTPIIWTSHSGKTYDTQDWQIAGGVVNSTTVYNNFETILNNDISTGFIVLEHDLYLQAVTLAVEYILPQAVSNASLNMMPIVACLGQQNSDAYIETAGNKSQISEVGASGTGVVPGLTSATIGFNAGATGTRSSSGSKSSGSSSSSSGSSGSSGSSNSSSGATTVAVNAAMALALCAGVVATIL